MPTSLVAQGEPPLQKISLTIECGETLQTCDLQVWSGERLLAEKTLGALDQGTNSVTVLLQELERPVPTRWVLSYGTKTLAEQALTWNPPRHWTLYIVKSAHVDIGLHDSQYKQRLMSVDFIDRARRLADQTADWPEASRYRYVIEGLWWWLNYPQDRSERAAGEVIENYVRRGLFDIGASHSGNHTQVYGAEELCRSAYYARQLRQRWGLAADTMLMVDNNGITWPLVTAYADAGIKHLLFLPNAWNPNTVGGSRIDVGWDSPLPHLFYWQGPDEKSRLLVWANPHYITTGDHFGIGTCRKPSGAVLAPDAIAPQMAKQLVLLESRYPYDVWLVSNYDDNETPNLRFPELAKAWNACWRWPELRTCGNLSEPFRKVEERFGDRIATLRGDITGGWAQHPVSTPSLLAMKRSADRLLPVAETLATLARLTDPDFLYPTIALRRAWEALVCNDEHGYGTSYYKGRPVYDTWMQKRDWIERALNTARAESDRALKSLAALVPAEGPSVFVFNPTLQPRSETVEVELPESCAGFRRIRHSDGTTAPTTAEGGKLRFRAAEVPPLGYAVFPLTEGDAGTVAKRPCAKPPSLENAFYRVTFGADGTIAGIFDKQLQRQLVDASAPYRCNQFVYTRDAHKTFSSPGQATFELETSALGQTAVARLDDPVSGAALEQRVTLPTHEKRIDIDNRLAHVRDLASPDRWHRFGYYAFPFDVPDGKFRVNLNGCVARPHEDQTGHGTEAYLAARDWTDIGNDRFGVALVQYDSYLVECGKIHADKKAFGQPPATTHLFAYVLNDWLYAHAYVTGPSHINLRYRYVIRSRAGNLADAGVAQFAERAVTPVLATVIPRAQKGQLPANRNSFLSVDASNVSLLALKLSETPGRGVIARFHETDGRPVAKVGVKLGWGPDLRLTRSSIVEEDRAVLPQPLLQLAPFGYDTLRIEPQGPLPPAPEVAIGECSDKCIALQWTPIAEARQYHIYRGEDADFAADEYHLLAATRQARHADDWLSPGAAYHYRVAAVTADARQGAVSPPVRAATQAAGTSPPAKVGSVCRGLIGDPRAWRGDEPDTLYLQWGQNAESDLSHYELYRGDTPDFELSEKTFVAKVEPGTSNQPVCCNSALIPARCGSTALAAAQPPYVVVPFEDKGLKPHTTYYYRVRAVDRDGHKGAPSEVCLGVTREPLDRSEGRMK
jgi:hypothetical protein